MIWLIALGLVAVLVACYVVGRNAIRQDQEDARQIDQARLDGALRPKTFGSETDGARPNQNERDARETVVLANAFHGHFTNGGFDTFFSAMRAREQSLDAVCRALDVVGARPIVPLLRQASAAEERYRREDEASEAPIGSEEHQRMVKAHLEEMRRLEAEVDRLGLDVGALSRGYAERNGV